MILEIAVFNIQSAIAATNAGADRLELCENPFDGGTTPSYGTLKTVREKINIPVFPIIRPRGGDFLYTEDEFEVLLKDVRLVKELGFEGLVTGLLLENGNIDIDRTSLLVELAYPLEVTFHRAFDRADNPLHAMEDVIKCGCQRILTSGQVPNAFDGKELIRQLVEAADDRITILPGSGVRANNAAEIIKFTKTSELHSSARKKVDSKMKYLKISMQEELESILIDIDEVQLMKKAMNSVEI